MPGDYNADGKPDLALVTTFTRVAVLLNSPGFAATLSNSSATGTIISDDLRDITPDAFLFTDVPGTVTAGSTQRSNAIEVKGINDSTPFSVSGGRANTSSLPCNPLTGATSGMVGAGSMISVCHVAGSAGSVNNTTLTIGAEGVVMGRGFLLGFRDITLNTSSPAQVVTLTNVGGTLLSISSIVTSGDFKHTPPVVPAWQRRAGARSRLSSSRPLSVTGPAPPGSSAMPCPART